MSRQTTVRLSEACLTLLDKLRVRHGLRSYAACIEYLCSYWRDTQGNDDEVETKKEGKCHGTNNK